MSHTIFERSYNSLTCDGKSALGKKEGETGNRALLGMFNGEQMPVQIVDRMSHVRMSWKQWLKLVVLRISPTTKYINSETVSTGNVLVNCYTLLIADWNKWVLRCFWNETRKWHEWMDEGRTFQTVGGAICNQHRDVLSDSDVVFLYFVFVFQVRQIQTVTQSQLVHLCVDPFKL